jgi:transcriptional regulator with XRE-family HTH domain
MEFGKLLRTMRESKGKTAGELAERLGWSSTYVYDIEKGGRVPPEEGRIREIAEFLDADPEVLLEAARRTRGYVRLALDSGESGKNELALALARRWETLDDETATRLRKLVEDIC